MCIQCHQISTLYKTFAKETNFSDKRNLKLINTTSSQNALQSRSKRLFACCILCTMCVCHTSKVSIMTLLLFMFVLINPEIKIKDFQECVLFVSMAKVFTT